jgi:hypothetical protein
MNHDSRVGRADQAIENAMMALTRAICLLGFSEGKEIVQRAHGMVAESRRLLHQHAMAPTRPVGVEAGWASSLDGGRALAVLDLAGELRQ